MLNRGSQMHPIAEAGLSTEDFNHLVSQDPNFTRNAFRESVRNYVGKFAGRKGQKTGKTKETAKDDFFETSKPVKPASVMGMGRRHADNRPFAEKWKKGEQRSGTSAEVLDMLTDMIDGDDPAFKVTR